MHARLIGLLECRRCGPGGMDIPARRTSESDGRVIERKPAGDRGTRCPNEHRETEQELAAWFRDGFDDVVAVDRGRCGLGMRRTGGGLMRLARVDGSPR